MKKKYIKIVIFLFLSILISCRGSKQCPPLDRNLLVWIPYEKDDAIRFVNAKNDTIQFKVSEKEIYDDLGKYKDLCDSKVSVIFQDNENEFIYTIYNSFDNSIIFNISMYFFNKSGVFDYSLKNYSSLQEQIIHDTIIDNQNYSNAIMISVDTIKYPDLSHFWKIIIAENKGIVKFYDRIDNETWTYIE
jgi:hypothetical protein